MLDKLKLQVCRANQDLYRLGLVVLTWGNVSGIDRKRGLVVIKPSGVPYAELTPENMAVVDLSGKTAQGKIRPSSDTPTHLALYQAWPEIGGVCHTHSAYAVMFSQARMPIPCLGTTHADNFYGPIPVTRPLSRKEVEGDYEANTGRLIVEHFKGRKPLEICAALVASHGPFTWGKNPEDAFANSVALEQIAQMAFGATLLKQGGLPVPQYLLDKHFLRKHGPHATYGQTKKS